jgi:hypothetical protein
LAPVVLVVLLDLVEQLVVLQFFLLLLPQVVVVAVQVLLEVQVVQAVVAEKIKPREQVILPQQVLHKVIQVVLVILPLFQVVVEVVLALLVRHLLLIFKAVQAVQELHHQ